MRDADDTGTTPAAAQDGEASRSPSWAVAGGAETPAATATLDAGAPSPHAASSARPEDVVTAEGAALPADAAPDADPRWARPVLAALLVVTAVGYLWNLDRNGWGNSFYAAAVQSGTHSWRSFFFGSFDWGDYITVDKPPVSLWIMALSGRVFGFGSWSMLAPEALLGVASVALLYLAVRRVWGAPAGLISAAVLALTPVAALMFRFNNPDAALTFLLVASAYTLTRALERGRLVWLCATAVLLGTAFLTKSLQAALPLPALAAAYLVGAPVTVRRRIGQLLAGGAVLVVSGLWWPLLVDAIPASRRPFVGGSTTNSVMELILGYNGLGRITGQEGGPGGGRPGGAMDRAAGALPAGPGGAMPPGGSRGGFGGGGFGGGGFGGQAGWDRMVNDQFASFIAWFLPAALVGVVAVVWLLRRSRWAGRPARLDPRLGSLIVWGGWTLVTAGVFSFAGGIVHTYYTVALAPGVAALAGMAVPALWRRRDLLTARMLLAASTAGTAATAFWLFENAGWLPWLGRAVLALGVVAAVLLLVPVARLPRAATGAVGAGALVACLAGPFAWSVVTVNTTHTGSIPTVGPAQAGRAGAGLPGGFPGGAPGQQDQRRQQRQQGQRAGGGLAQPAGDGLDQPAGGGPGGEGAVTDPALVTLLRAGADGYRWVAAASGSQTAGPVQLAVDAPVMSLGGFGGGDAAITLDRFKELVAAGQVHYYLGGGFGGPGGGRGGTSSVAEWVSSTFTATTVGSTTVYDLTSARTG